jgi:hypothetical protein
VKLAAGVAMAVALSGCVQATRHSNTMVFGTNTSFGIKVGTDVAQVPGIQVGYNRQEAVILPLLANTAQSNTNGADGVPLNRLIPCPLPDRVLQPDQTHACQFVAVRGDARDSYSALASFGAEFGGAQGTELKAQGGLAQYFATGMAAQLLAATGGASVVNALGTSPPDGGAAAAAALFGTPKQYQEVTAQVQSYNSVRTQISAKIVGAQSAALMLQRLRDFEAAVSSGSTLSGWCAARELDQAECAAELDGRLASTYFAAYDRSGGPQAFTNALNGWVN